MHADLVKLLDLQAKDIALVTAERKLEAARQEVAQLDGVLQRARDALAATRRTAAESVRRREELETKIENYRTLQERRRQQLEQVRHPREASALMAELDLARSVLAKEEGEWFRSAEVVSQHERRVEEEERALAALEAEQASRRAEIARQVRALEAERDAVLQQREESASRLNRSLRTRYDRLRRARATDVVVPLVGGACGACYTSVPLNRRSQIRSGQVLDGCEACGAILYPPEAAESP